VYAFEQTNKGTFTLSSSSGIDSNTITLTLNGVLWTNLSITGTSTNWVVNYYGMTKNISYTAVISCYSLNGGGFLKTINFDTFSNQYYTWEAEDYDYTSSGGVAGLFFDNPQVCAYMYVSATSGVDYFYGGNAQSANTPLYRVTGWVAGTANNVFGLVIAGDQARVQFPGTSPTNTDYNVSFYNAGAWTHYTRHYPAGSYNVMGRFRDGYSGTALQASLSKVTQPAFGTGEAMTTLGYFNLTNGTWSINQNVMLTDTTGSNWTTVTFDGSQSTLRLDALINGVPGDKLQRVLLHVGSCPADRAADGTHVGR